MKPKLLVITGTTSTGKTDIAIKLAKKLNGELVSADSRQVYKYLDLGTGKLPGNFERLEKNNSHWKIDGVNIWLYDAVDPETRFNLYQYLLRSSEKISEIIEEKKLPILAGGTGLYIRSLLEGVTTFGVEENTNLRNELESLGIEEIKKRIPERKLNSLNESDINNKRRLIRLAEISSSSEITQKFEGLENKYDVLKIGLNASREIIRQKIKSRLEKRIKEGMIEESRNLLGKKILSFKRMEELGLEYRYIAKYIKGEIKTKQELIEILSIKISQFAKRQETWFRKEKNIIWFDITARDFDASLVKTVGDWYNLNPNEQRQEN